MATAHSTRRHPLLCFCIFLSSMLSLSHGRLTPNFKIRAVNLGGWLVTEGWIKPSLFDGIPNKDFLDGSGLQFKSVTAGKYLCAETGGGSIIVANRTVASSWETFKLWRINETSYQLRVLNKQFVGVDSGGNGIDMVAMVADTPGRSETFEIVRNSDDLNRVRIKAPNGFFLQVKTENLVTADSKGDGSWGNDDQSVFIVTNIGGLHGEFQLTNGYGLVNAPQVMTEHWNTFIVEDDFNFISSNGINAVRIPVGWWIACDPTPPQPYVGGSLQALDNAFVWAQKYGINVIIDLHAVPGFQNGYEHSSSRDGSQEWGLSDQNIQETVNVIDFWTSRYANNPSLYAVKLLNEPLSPGASLDSLNKYYSAGYNVVQKYSSTAYVIMSNRLGAIDPQELFPIEVNKEGHVTADSKGDGGWKDDDPSVFEMKIGRQFDGEFQVTNGYGKLAPKAMREHWNTFVTEDDFKFISSNGINTLRIPVGWWIAFDPTPPAPYVGGSLKALDNAFSWARKYGMKVIIDLHAAPGSQTKSAVSSSRDGFVEWGQTDQNIQETVDVIDFLTARYAKHPSLYAVELLNEPCAPYVTLEKLKKYYRAGYNAVRKHSSMPYVIMASRMQYGMKPVDPTELFPLARELKGSAIDVHYYQIFMPVFKKMNHQQNIDFVYTNTSVELNRLIRPNNPQIFIGEWATVWGTANLAHPNLSKKTIEDYKKFGKAQLQVYGTATFGWAYWTLKCPFSHLSFEWMIKNGYLKL